MLPFEKALKRLEEKKNYKPKDVNYDLEYIKILRKRENHLYDVYKNYKNTILYNELEQEQAKKELNTVNYLVSCLEQKIWGNK